MTTHNEMRLLPWSGAEGKPCFLSTDDNSGHLSRLADNIEAVQLGMVSELLEHASEVLGDEETEPEELRHLATNLTEALHNVLRVATSRGHRLPIPDLSAREGGDEGARLTEAAFG
ncbi:MULTISPECIES: hypothetical protein [unclassified Streptomyces]|uniref:hypothetical protein n=1 Tax=unclassified Streptomyces TaxID=2593676 RepID=UPI00081B7402|nr:MULTISPECIES: hypothetical protein [unclassified Streptomyces]MYQ88129.1 hypothetical protein [Streptomyces sp. SID4936]SCE52802.1 hypothetical protein GA0115234_1104188 [Streptomyces sp. DvalAA-43]